MHTFRTLVALLFLASAFLRLSHGQTIRGTVLDDSTSQPIAAAEVSVLDTLGAVLTQAITDSAGRFLVAVSPGDYAFRVLRIGYTPTVTTVLHAATDANELSVVIRVPSTGAVVGNDAYALTPIVVEAPPADRYLASFYRHQEMGMGDFAVRDEFEQWHPIQVIDVLRRMRGFTILPNAYYGQPLPDGTIDTRQYIIDVPGRPHRRGQVECPPLLFLDGASMGNSQRIDVNMLPLDAIEAVEAYSRPIQTPLAYHRPGNDCGVIALWTRTAESGDLGSPFEVGVRYGGTLAGGPFVGGRLGIHLVTRFFGSLEFYPAVYVISSAFSSNNALENSSWMAHIALRTTLLRERFPFYVGSGLVMVKIDQRYQVMSDAPDIDPRYTLFAGLKREVGILKPFLEFHLLDFFAPSSTSAQAFLGTGFQF